MKSILIVSESNNLRVISNGLNPLNEIVNLISGAVIEEPSNQTGTGKVFREGYNHELDEYIEAKFSAKNWVSSFQESERQRSGISSLKVRFTSVFGYYIEISNAHKTRIPENYDRKQTLANAERYITPELKEFETKILNAEEKIGELEGALFSELLMKIALKTQEIQDNAFRIATIDCLQSYGQASVEYNYIEPDIDESETIDIVDGRHPVVEKLLPVGERFQSNSLSLDTESEMIHIINQPTWRGNPVTCVRLH